MWDELFEAATEEATSTFVDDPGLIDDPSLDPWGAVDEPVETDPYDPAVEESSYATETIDETASELEPEDDWRWLKNSDTGNWQQWRESSLWDNGSTVQIPGSETEYGSWGGGESGWLYDTAELSGSEQATDAIPPEEVSEPTTDVAPPDTEPETTGNWTTESADSSMDDSASSSME